MGWGSIASAVSNFAGGLADRQENRHSAKQQYTYNSWLQQQNIDFQREMAKNAHQYEMEDLEKAGLNPALTVTGSSAGSIAGGSASQGTGPGANYGGLSEIVSGVNQTRKTNAEVENLDKETETIPQKLNNEATNAKANLISAEAQKKQAETQEKLAEGGIGSSIFGTEYGGLASSLATTLALPLGGGIAGAAIKGINLYKKVKMAKGFSNFIKAATSAKK